MEEERISPYRRLRISIGAIFTLLLVVIAALASVVLMILPWWVAAVLAVAALLVAIPLAWLRRLLSRRGRFPVTPYLATTVALFILASGAVALPIYWLAYLIDARPTLMPLVTLSDGKKTVQFQGMQHVGSEGFYKNVVYDLREALGQGYKLYYEGVKPVEGRSDLQQWFDKFATEGHGDLSEHYKALAEGCGLQFQLNYFQGLTKDMAVHPESHVAADVDYSEMKAEYDRLMRDDAAFAAALSRANDPKAASEFDAFKLFLDSWRVATPDQQRLLGLACRGFFSFAFSQKAQANERDKLILDFRNARLAKMIAAAPDLKIYVTYGARHVPGVIEDLQAIDPAWKVVSVKWTPAIANPETRKGVLE